MQLTLTALTTLLTLTTATPAITQHNPNATWEFSVYQNTHCTGEITAFSGYSSIPCRDTILNGGALAYIPEKIATHNCSVALFSDDECTVNQTVGVIRAGSLRGCRVPGGEIRSFWVRC